MEIVAYPQSGMLADNKEEQVTDIHARRESQNFMLRKQSQTQKIS